MPAEKQVEPQNPYAPLEIGVMEQELELGKIKRKFLTYIPQGTRPSTSGILILGSDGSSALEMLEKSGWKETADQDTSKEKMILFFLEPLNSKWNIQEEYNDPSGDVAYVLSVLYTCSKRLHYCVHESKFYLYGMGEGGCIAQMAAMYNPAKLAGLAAVNAGDISPSYYKACAKDPAGDLHGFFDQNFMLGRLKGDIPLPVWLIDTDSTKKSKHSVDYWKWANKTACHPRRIDNNTVEYSRISDTEYPLNQDKVAYRVWHSQFDAGEDSSILTAGYLWENFLSKHRRWMGDIAGDLRMTADPVDDLGMEYHRADIGGWNREWYVYVPTSVRENPERKAPLVFAMHGYSCTGEIYAGHSAWHRVAEDRGFILIHPTAVPGMIDIESEVTGPDNIPLPTWNFMHQTPNGPDEFEFFEEMLKQTSHKYPVDLTRVYATGHSHGSMMTQALALGMPQIFAAAAPCSGVIFEQMFDQFTSLSDFKNDKDHPVPIWMFAGRREDGFIDAEPTLSNATGKSIALWCKKNHADITEEELFHGNYHVYKDRFHDLIYFNSNGEQVVRYTAIDHFPHAVVPELSYRIWDEFFAHWSRIGNKIVYL